MKVKTPAKFGRVSKTIKTKRTKYEPKQMESALEAVKLGSMNFTEASQVFDVRRQTLKWQT